MEKLKRLLARVVPVSSGCWIWQGPICRLGYGKVWFDGKNTSAHRVMYVLAKGPIPAGFDIDHLCKVRSCCNPAHLEAVTHQENIRRGDTGIVNRSKTHCPQGHPYSGENLHIRPGGGRRCKECNCIQARAYYHKHKKERAAYARAYNKSHRKELAAYAQARYRKRKERHEVTSDNGSD